ncbi:LysR family transcriptional regulator [Flavobacterium notoginsengisoli]|uniref:LysR family transcriptional regulator n=1 Tax=Flavobacterium notoginsengisoli TaxID=1478199 RepID=UPI003625D19F
MELRQLKYFVRAAELLNFTQAAEDLFITQSTLSHQIKELENSLDTLLFDRIAKRVRLTEAGEVMLQYARKTIHQAEESRQVLLDLNNMKSGKIIIGSTYGLQELLMESIVEYNEKYPDIEIQIIYGSTTDLLQKTLDYEIDCMLSFMPESGHNELIINKLFSAHLSLIVHQSHSWAKLKKVALEKVTALPLALPSQSYSIRNLLDKLLDDKGISLHTKIEINDIHSLLQLANTNKWSTILMNTSLFDFKELKAIPLEGKNTVREATIAISKGIYHKKSLVLFQEILLKKSEVYRNE